MNKPENLIFKSYFQSVDELIHFDLVKKNLANLKISDNYIEAGNLKIISANECVFYEAEVVNFTNTRKTTSRILPNYSLVKIKKNELDFSKYNSWDFKIDYEREFEKSESIHDIPESHHTTTCSDCLGNGTNRCYSCNGNGNVTCNSCGGAGRTKCSSCKGKGENFCIWCLGTGKVSDTTKDGSSYKRNCRQCNGRGQTPCSCDGGYDNCSNCANSGKETCHVCNGNGDVICDTCEGYKKLDNFLEINSSFENKIKSFTISAFSKGYDKAKSIENLFDNSFEKSNVIKEKFSKSDLELLNITENLGLILNYLNFYNNDSCKVIKSKISFFEIKYHETRFELYEEEFLLISCPISGNSYYSGVDPSASYQSRFIENVIIDLENKDFKKLQNLLEEEKNELIFNIPVNELKIQVNDTLNIIESYDFYNEKKYLNSEKLLKEITNSKLNDYDFKYLRKKLNLVYLINFLKFSVPFYLICYLFLFMSYSETFAFRQAFVLTGFLALSTWLIYLIKRVMFSRIFGILLVVPFIIFTHLYSNLLGNETYNDQKLNFEFQKFTKGKIKAFDGKDTLIIIQDFGEVVPQDINKDVLPYIQADKATYLKVVKNNINDFKINKIYYVQIWSNNWSFFKKGWTKTITVRNTFKF